MTEIQTITLAGERYAVIPFAEYDALRTAVDEDALDAAVLRRILDDSSQEWVPAHLVKRLIDGEHPVRVWRDHRRMSGKELATAAGIASSYLSAIETGKKPGSVNALKRIAAALGVTLDELV